VTSCITVLLFLSSIAWSISQLFCLFCLLMYILSIWHLRQRLYHFEHGKPLKNLFSSHYLLSKTYFQHFEGFHSIFPQFKVKSVADTLFFQATYFLGTLKWQDIIEQSHVLQPYSKWQMTSQTIYLHLAIELHPSSSIVISWSVWELFDHILLFEICDV
jgi:hypothetical protein